MRGITRRGRRKAAGGRWAHATERLATAGVADLKHERCIKGNGMYRPDAARSLPRAAGVRGLIKGGA